MPPRSDERERGNGDARRRGGVGGSACRADQVTHARSIMGSGAQDQPPGGAWVIRLHKQPTGRAPGRRPHGGPGLCVTLGASQSRDRRLESEIPRTVEREFGKGTRRVTPFQTPRLRENIFGVYSGQVRNPTKCVRSTQWKEVQFLECKTHLCTFQASNFDVMEVLFVRPDICGSAPAQCTSLLDPP